MSSVPSSAGPVELGVVEDGELRREAETAARFYEARHADNTRRAYAAGWKAYTSWCRSRSLDPLHADAGQIATFLSTLAAPVRDSKGKVVRPGRKISTLEARLAAIRHGLREQGLSIDAGDDRIRGVLRGMRRELPKDQVQAKPVAALTVDPMEKVLGALDSSRDLDLRDRALLLVMFAGLLRRSEIAGIRIEEMRWAEAGVQIHIPRSKTAAPGEGRVKRIPRIRRASQDSRGRPLLVSVPLCPVAAIEDWLRASHLREGPLFPGWTLTRVWSTQGLSGSQVARIVKARCAAAGVDTRREDHPTGLVKIERLQFSGHSLRRGAATSADRAEVGLLELMKAGDWRDMRTTARYVDEVQEFDKTAAAKVLGGQGRFDTDNRD